MPGHVPNGLSKAFFARSVHDVAPELIGATLLVDGVGGLVVEVEAYDQQDPASHAYRGQTPRNASMFGPAGHAYVYLSLIHISEPHETPEHLVCRLLLEKK